MWKDPSWQNGQDDLFSGISLPIDANVMVFSNLRFNPLHIDIMEVYGSKPVVKKVGIWNGNFNMTSMLRRVDMMGLKIKISALNVSFRNQAKK